MKQQLQTLRMRCGKIEDWLIAEEAQVIRHAKKMIKQGYEVVSICTDSEVFIKCKPRGKPLE